MYRHILIATDGSDLSGRAVGAGLKLALALRARVSVVTVTPPFHTFSLAPAQAEYSVASYAAHAREDAARTLAAVHAQADATGIACETVHATHDHPWEAIIETARTRQCDLIIMASHGRRGIGAILVGSETLRVLTHSTIPVLVYR